MPSGVALGLFAKKKNSFANYHQELSQSLYSSYTQSSVLQSLVNGFASSCQFGAPCPPSTSLMVEHGRNL